MAGPTNTPRTAIAVAAGAQVDTATLRGLVRMAALVVMDEVGETDTALATAIAIKASQYLRDHLTGHGVTALSPDSDTDQRSQDDLPPCGHDPMVAGCGGCDPTAIEFVVLENGTQRRFDPARDLTTATRCD